MHYCKYVILYRIIPTIVSNSCEEIYKFQFLQILNSCQISVIMFLSKLLFSLRFDLAAKFSCKKLQNIYGIVSNLCHFRSKYHNESKLNGKSMSKWGPRVVHFCHKSSLHALLQTCHLSSYYTYHSK